MLSLNILPQKLFQWFRRSQLWATGDWQLHHDNVPAHVSCLVQFFCETSNHSGDSVPFKVGCQSSVAHSCGLLNHLNSFHGGMFKLNTKFDADLLLNSLSHFECDSHTVHGLTQWSLPPSLTSTVKSSLFTHVHSSPLSLAARLHWCCRNHSCYINHGWNFPDRPRI